MHFTTEPAKVVLFGWLSLGVFALLPKLFLEQVLCFIYPGQLNTILCSDDIIFCVLQDSSFGIGDNDVTSSDNAIEIFFETWFRTEFCRIKEEYFRIYA